MSMVVQFPEGGAYPSAPLSKQDERVLALLRRSLAAWAVLNQAYLRIDHDEANCSPQEMAKLAHLHEAALKPETELAMLAEQDLSLRSWLEISIGRVVVDAQYRRERTNTRGGRNRP